MTTIQINRLGHSRVFVEPILLDAEGHVTVCSKTGDMPLHEFVEGLGDARSVWLDLHALEVTVEVEYRPRGRSGVVQA